MVVALATAIARLVSGAHSGSFSPAVCDIVPRSDLKGVGHPLSWIQSAMQASSPAALPQVACSSVVARWLLCSDFVGIWPESLWTRSHLPFTFEVLFALSQDCFVIFFLA
jgi:hypothetical protein